MKDSKLIHTAPNKWITNNNLQYSFGWLGTKCQPTSYYLLITGKIYLYDEKVLFLILKMLNTVLYNQENAKLIQVLSFGTHKKQGINVYTKL